MSTYTSHRAKRRPFGYKGEHRHHNGKPRSFFKVSMATLLAAAFVSSCAGGPNPNDLPTPAPGPAVTRHTTPAPEGVRVVLR